MWRLAWFRLAAASEPGACAGMARRFLIAPAPNGAGTNTAAASGITRQYKYRNTPASPGNGFEQFFCRPVYLRVRLCALMEGT
jgi:hypothetical protein